MEPSTQDLASRYQFKSLLGEGGAGQVYTAWDKHLRRTVAIKQIKIGQLEGEDVRDTWQEAMCLASVRHSNIVTVYDLGIDGDTPYIVMEYVQGETLERAVERSSLDISTFIDIARQCLDGLCGAHHAGLVHRDLKPANIMLCRLPTGFYQVKILDFGIASFFQEGDQVLEKSDRAICGSIHWISPEQIEGKQATERSDLYSLGCVYYFALTGMPPFSAATREGIIKAHLDHSVMPIEKLRPDLPAPLCKWVMRLMSRDPAERPARSTLALEEFEIITGRRQASTNSLPLPPPAAGPSLSPVDDATCSFNFESEPVNTSDAPTNRVPLIPPLEDRRQNKQRLILAGALILVVLTGLIAGFTMFAGGAGTPKSATTATIPPAVLRIHGSNTVGSKLGPALVEAFLQQKGFKDIQIKTGAVQLERHVDFSTDTGSTAQCVEIRSHGSRTGFTSLANGTCDLAASSSPVKDDIRADLIEKGLGDMRTPACEHVIGLDGLAVIVHPDNAVSRLQRSQIADVFSGAIRDWSELGRKKGGPIHLYARDANSGTFDSFQSLVLDEEKLSDNAKRFEDSGDLSAAVSIDPDGIGFVGLPYIKNCKAIAVGDGQCAPLIPTPFTVATEDYPLSRRLYLYSPAESKNTWARELIDFSLGPDGQDVVSKAGFVKQAIEAFRINLPPNAPASYAALSKGADRLSLSLRFKGDESALDTKAERDLDRLVAALAGSKFENKDVLLLGFSDDSGDVAQDLARSKKFADMVSNELEIRGVKAKLVEGFGSELPLGSNSDANGRNKNRRVEVWIRNPNG